ncbi:hypothetical protein EJ04DRAFT_461305 [Polyplosphaeria fusca]|uniref:Uncharacterized protein n=1 Tax=Polyplosphaeria fusca TaxID=682080 RepID=A0A9P4R1L6_9PLEO|nr:hypothetical protein EJ04DRAFT_461305 [Polyplosphaeria fusca]
MASPTPPIATTTPTLPSTPTPPILCPPILLRPPQLRHLPNVVDKIRHLANHAFVRPKSRFPDQWHCVPGTRFPDTESLFRMLGAHGIMCIVVDTAARCSDAAGGADGAGFRLEEGDRVAGIAAVVPWIGVADGVWPEEQVEAAKREERGWEVKSVCVEGDGRYAKMGIAVRMMGELEGWVVERERERKRVDVLGREDGGGGKEVARFWIQAAEILNGVYWRKRGYREVRRAEVRGIWTCKTSFELVVFVKEVEYGV